MSYNVEIAVGLVIGFSIIGALVIIFIIYNNPKKNKKIEWYDEFLSDEYVDFKNADERRYIYNAILDAIKNSHNSELVNKLNNKYHRLIDTKTIQDIDDFINIDLNRFNYTNDALEYYYGFIRRLELVIKKHPDNIEYKNKLEIATKKYKYISYIVKNIDDIRKTKSNDIVDIIDIYNYKKQGIIRDNEFDEYLDKYMGIINKNSILSEYMNIINSIPISNTDDLNKIYTFIKKNKTSIYGNKDIDISDIDKYISKDDLYNYAFNYNLDKKDKKFYEIQAKLLDDGIIAENIIIHPPQ